MHLAVAWDGQYTPKLEDEIGNLGVVLHSFLSSGKHYYLGKTPSTISSDDWNRAESDYKAQSRASRTIELFELKHFQRKYPNAGHATRYTYTDGMDLLLMLLDSEFSCSLDLAKQHPLLWTDGAVMSLLEQLEKLFHDRSSDGVKRLQRRVMQSLEVFSKGSTAEINKEVSFVISRFPLGLRQLMTMSRSDYLDLLVGYDAAKALGRESDFHRQGWSSCLPGEVTDSLRGLYR
eukprot:1643337-Prymnesium_polylepis.3